MRFDVAVLVRTHEVGSCCGNFATAWPSRGHSDTLIAMPASSARSSERLSDQSLRPKTDLLGVFGISALLVLPCFWHEFLVCVDLGSHTYTTWIGVLIAAGKTPSLYLAPQKTNILFDWLLSASCAYFGYAMGEKIAAAIAVLIFFWGVFAFLNSVAGRMRWELALPLAMFSYGWTFQTGLFNFYLLSFCWIRICRASGSVDPFPARTNRFSLIATTDLAGASPGNSGIRRHRDYGTPGAQIFMARDRRGIRRGCRFDRRCPNLHRLARIRNVFRSTFLDHNRCRPGSALQPALLLDHVGRVGRDSRSRR
jgi:hypothetical protein